MRTLTIRLYPTVVACFAIEAAARIAQQDAARAAAFIQAAMQYTKAELTLVTAPEYSAYPSVRPIFWRSTYTPESIAHGLWPRYKE